MSLTTTGDEQICDAGLLCLVKVSSTRVQIIVKPGWKPAGSRLARIGMLSLRAAEDPSKSISLSVVSLARLHRALHRLLEVIKFRRDGFEDRSRAESSRV